MKKIFKPKLLTLTACLAFSMLSTIAYADMGDGNVDFVALNIEPPSNEINLYDRDLQLYITDFFENLRNTGSAQVTQAFPFFAPGSLSYNQKTLFFSAFLGLATGLYVSSVVVKAQPEGIDKKNVDFAIGVCSAVPTGFMSWAYASQVALVNKQDKRNFNLLENLVTFSVGLTAVMVRAGCINVAYDLLPKSPNGVVSREVFDASNRAVLDWFQRYRDNLSDKKAFWEKYANKTCWFSTECKVATNGLNAYNRMNSEIENKLQQMENTTRSISNNIYNYYSFRQDQFACVNKVHQEPECMADLVAKQQDNFVNAAELASVLKRQQVELGVLIRPFVAVMEPLPPIIFPNGNVDDPFGVVERIELRR